MEAYLVVIAKQLIQEVDSVVADKPLIFGVDKTVPVLLGKSSEDIVVLCIELDLILVQVVEEILCTENFGDLDQLIGVAVSVEEWFFAEDHGSEHSTQ